MSRELLVLRHAKSDWDSNADKDFNRPLAKRGKNDAPRIGAWMYREGLIPAYVVCSPAERARQTVIKVCKTLEFKKKDIVWEKGIYDAELTDLLGILSRCPKGASTVLLVGHNPGLEELVRFLAGDDIDESEDDKLLPTASLARLEMPADWHSLESGSAQLISLTCPRNLPS